MVFAATATVFSALGAPLRVSIFSAVARAGSDGIAAGEIAGIVEARQSTVSAALRILREADLLVGKRQGRSIQYVARLSTLMNAAGMVLGLHDELQFRNGYAP